jgi:hypothetical protein
MLAPARTVTCALEGLADGRRPPPGGSKDCKRPGLARHRQGVRTSMLPGGPIGIESALAAADVFSFYPPEENSSEAMRLAIKVSSLIPCLMLFIQKFRPLVSADRNKYC